MKIQKTATVPLTKCYSLAEVRYHGQTCYLAASEKQHPCLLLDGQGTVLETVWEGPGGTMTIDPLPGEDGAFLATHRFYSPNDSAEASIVLAYPGEGGWQVKTLCELPFVHRFGVLRRDGKQYIAAATLKSAHAYKDDWTCPGRVWVGELPEDIRNCESLVLRPIISGLTRNHGFFKLEEKEYTEALIGAENGVYRITPPARDGQWECVQILDVPASDIAVGDFDGDGIREMLVFSPFHGDKLAVYKPENDIYRPVYVCDRPLPFLHAIAVCRFDGRDTAVVGYRKGDRCLLLLRWTPEGYRTDVIDRDVGPANVLCRPEGRGMQILSANREIDEAAIYYISV